MNDTGTQTNTIKGPSAALRTGKTLTGVVVKSAMKDTATVLVTRYVKQPKYKKYVKRVKKYLAHDPGNTTEVGSKVTIRETRPISKLKHFEIVK
jgi:small subunit ribosomal protein S17